MTNDPRTIVLDPESELARVLAGQDSTPVMVDSNGVRYVVKRQSDDVFAGYEPQRVRKALRQSAGILRNVDIDKLKRDLRDQRAQDSSGRPG